MLAQERFERILEILREKQSVTVVELTEKLNTSESTIRRDLTELNRQGLLIKVHGGATAIKSVLSREEEVITKSKKHQEEKRKIAKYAASLINKEDIVYLDAGTTTEMMLDYLREYDVIYVTNGITHARKLMNAGFKVHLIGGEIKAVTEALVGEEALEQLDKYNFTKGFFGTNGIDMKRGFTTPDQKEAAVKKLLLDIAVEDILAFESGLFDYIKTKYPEIPESIKNDKVLKEEVEEALRKAIGEYKEQFQAR